MAEGTTPEELIVQAIESARDAMEHYAEAKLHRFAREATRSLEMAAKAALAKISPVLIADPKSVESQLYLAGDPAARSKGARRIRTISCREALERATRFVPTLRVEDVDQLISVRDGSTHYLVSEGQALESLVIPYLASFMLLQQRLELSDEDVFGSYADLVSFVREKHTKEVDRKVAAKMARAKLAFEERYGHLDANALKAVLQAIDANIVLDKYDDQRMECPACARPGVISGEHELQSWEVDVDEDGSANGYPVVTLFASEFNCPSCGLHLEMDELIAAGLETELDVQNAEAEDFTDFDDEYDPDDFAERSWPDESELPFR